MGLSSAAPAVAEDVHMSPDRGGKNMTCSACHVTDPTKPHLIGGRGIDRSKRRDVWALFGSRRSFGKLT